MSANTLSASESVGAGHADSAERRHHAPPALPAHDAAAMPRSRRLRHELDTFGIERRLLMIELEYALIGVIVLLAWLLH